MSKALEWANLMVDDDGLAFLRGGGKTGRLVAEFDWGATSIGPARAWPQSLKTAASILLRSPVAIVLLWSEDGIMIYNDAYSRFAGNRHPEVLGMKVRESWPEVAEFNDKVMKVVMAGGKLSYSDQELTLVRDGIPEPAWMNLDYSPVLDESGRPGGVMAIVVETTQRVLAERRLSAERERLHQLFEQAHGFMALLRGAEHVFVAANPTYFQLVGHREIIGKRARDALPEISGQGFFELLDRVYRTGQPFKGSAVKVGLQRTPSGVVEERYLDFIYQPIVEDGGTISGIFAEGYDVTDRVRGEAHLRLLMSELKHRVKNTLAMVQAIAMQTLRGSAALTQARNSLIERVQALSRAQDLLTREDWEGADLATVVATAIEPHRSREQDRFSIVGPHVLLGRRAAISLSLAVHELATNAAKYGALSTERGQVRIEWAIEVGSKPALRFRWTETGGPPVAAPTRKGFGSQLIERSLEMEFGADVNVDFAPCGLVYTMAAPLASIAQDGGSYGDDLA